MGVREREGERETQRRREERGLDLQEAGTYCLATLLWLRASTARAMRVCRPVSSVAG